MNTALFLFFSIAIAGAEPFVPFGSLLISWASVVGIRRQDWFALLTMVLAGVIRDVLLVNKLGVSSAIVVATWALSRAAISRFDRPLLIAVVAGAIGNMTIVFLEQQRPLPAVIAGILASFLFLGISGKLYPSGKVTLRLR